jgi:hypothetical protein
MTLLTKGNTFFLQHGEDVVAYMMLPTTTQMGIRLRATQVSSGPQVALPRGMLPQTLLPALVERTPESDNLIPAEDHKQEIKLVKAVKPKAVASQR